MLLMKRKKRGLKFNPGLALEPAFKQLGPGWQIISYVPPHQSDCPCICRHDLHPVATSALYPLPMNKRRNTLTRPC